MTTVAELIRTCADKSDPGTAVTITFVRGGKFVASTVIGGRSVSALKPELEAALTQLAEHLGASPQAITYAPPVTRDLDGWTPTHVERICGLISRGIAPHIAARSLGISDAKFSKWMRRALSGEPPFADTYERFMQAMAECEQRLVTKLSDAAEEDWKAALEMLKRHSPERWADRKEISVKVEGVDLSKMNKPQLVAYCRNLLKEAESMPDEGDHENASR